MVKTIFRANTEKQIRFEEMVENVSRLAEVDQTTVHNACNQAVNSWEFIEGRNIRTIFNESVPSRVTDVDKLQTLVKEFLSPILKSEEIINNSMTVVNFAFEKIFGTR